VPSFLLEELTPRGSNQSVEHPCSQLVVLICFPISMWPCPLLPSCSLAGRSMGQVIPALLTVVRVAAGSDERSKGVRDGGMLGLSFVI